MSNANWTKIRLLLALALASAPLIKAETTAGVNTATAAPKKAKKHKNKKRKKNAAKTAATTATATPVAKKHKKKKHKKSHLNAPAGKDTATAVKNKKEKEIATGLNHNASIVRNFKHIPGQSRLLFYNPTTNATRAVGIDGKTQYFLEKGKWVNQEFPADMSGYFAISTSGKALSDSQVDALVKAGDLAALADHAITADIVAQHPELAGTTILTPDEVKAIQDMRNAAIEQGNIFVAGLSADGKLIKNAGITKEKLQGTEWKEVDGTTGLYELPGGIEKIAINGLSHVWGINKANEVVFKSSLEGKDDWEQVPGLRKQIVINNHDHVWSLGVDGKMYVRLGITNVDPNGSGWAQIPGWASSIAINDNNMMYHIGGNGGVWARKGITAENPAGTDWVQIKTPAEEPRLRQISINNQNQLWAIGAVTGTAYTLNGITAENPAGTTWTTLPGKLKQIAATNNGAWCIDDSNKVFFRENVTAANPDGTGWAGPFPHDLTYIFASGTRIAEPKLTEVQAAVKEKQTNHRLVKMQRRLETLKGKVEKAQGADKEKLTKAIAHIEKRIARLSKNDAVSTDVAAVATGKKGKKHAATGAAKKGNKHKKNATGAAKTGNKHKKNATGAVRTGAVRTGAVRTRAIRTGKKKNKKHKKNKKNKATNAVAAPAAAPVAPVAPATQAAPAA